MKWTRFVIGGLLFLPEHGEAGTRPLQERESRPEVRRVADERPGMDTVYIPTGREVAPSEQEKAREHPFFSGNSPIEHLQQKIEVLERKIEDLEKKSPISREGNIRIGTEGSNIKIESTGSNLTVSTPGTITLQGAAIISNHPITYQQSNNSY
jgi:hypothetical protein